MKKMKLIAGLLLTTMGVVSTTVCTQNMEVTDFVNEQDRVKVLSMFSDNWQWMGMDNAQDTDHLESMYDNSEDDKEGMCYKVIRVKGEVVAFIFYSYDLSFDCFGACDFTNACDLTGYISFLVVDSNCHHCGYGKQLMEYAINDMRAHGVTEISLCTHKDNVVARKLYENKLGFQVEEDDYISLVLYLA